MFKKFILLVLALFMFCSCKPKSFVNKSQRLTILASEGIASMATIYFEDDAKIAKNEEEIKNAFSSEKYDFIVCPIVDGVKYVKEFKKYELYGVVNWGSLEFYSKKSGFSKGTVYVSDNSNNKTTLKLLEYMDKYLNSYSFVSVDSVDEAISKYKDTKYCGIILEQPYASWFVKQADKDNVSHYKAEDLINVYQNLTGDDYYPGLALFVSNKSITNKLSLCNQYANTVKSYISKMNGDSKFLESAFLYQNALIESWPINYKEYFNDIKFGFEFISSCLKRVKTYLDIFDLELNESEYVR